MKPTNQTHPVYLEEPESRRLEFKEHFPKGEQVARTVVAFANGAGGKIIFGVRDAPREIIGIPEDELFPMEARITSSIFDQCTPAIAPEVYIQSASGKTLLVVEIFPGSNKPYHIKKHGKQHGTYIRVGASNRKASPETIEALERQRRKLSFDSLPVHDCPPETVNLDSFKKAYSSLTGKSLGKTQLQNMGLLCLDRDQIHPAHAAVLLSDSPVRKRYFPFAKIECARFKGTDKQVFLDQATVEGPIHATLEPCMAFIKKNISLSATIGEIYRQERWEYPLEAVREALINAVIHRDYAILGSDIKVAIYDDMLEITSPGPLPDSLPIEELGTGRSEIRNRVLAPIFKDLKLIEAWGSGIQKMKKEINEYPEIDLVLQEAGHAFQVQFVKRQKAGAESRQGEGRVKPESQPESSQSEARVEPEFIKDRVLYVLATGPLSKAEISRKLGQKDVSGPLNAIIRKLRKEGVIEYTIPEKPNSRLQKYRLTNKPPSRGGKDNE
jgi:ATP-dependent DNA helicase RecG